MEFDDQAAYEAYNGHPEHVAFVQHAVCDHGRRGDGSLLLRPALLGRRLGRPRQLGGVYHRGRPEALEIIGFRHPAGRGDDVMTEL